MVLLAVVLFFRLLLPARIIENWYSRRLFVVFREGWDVLLPRLPFPLFYLFWLLVAGWILRWGWQIWRGRRFRESWKAQGRKLINAIALLVSVFLLGWGFNYGRQEVNEVIGFDLYQPSLPELRERVYAEAAELAELRRRITADTTALDASFFPDLESTVRPALETALRQQGYYPAGRPRVRELRPRGLLLHLSTAGVYWPWVGEGNIDAGLHPLQKIPVAAHEMAHAYGFGDEGTCTFWAWMAGQQVKDPAPAYAFKLAYWRRIAGKLRQQEPEAYWEWRAGNLAPGIRNDLQAIYDNAELYQDIAPVIRDATYDAYLKAQGIHEGLLNYGKVVQLVEGYRRR